MFEQLDKKNLIIILVSLTVIASFLLLYDPLHILHFQESRSFYQESQRFGGIPTYDSKGAWDYANCPNNIADSLVYSVYIINYENGSVANFTCEFGPKYTYVATTTPFPVIKNCSRETAESIDDVVKGRNKSVMGYITLDGTYPAFKNYSVSFFFCKQNPDKNERGNYTYSVMYYLNYSGYTFG
ncbi:hypothetical protein H0N99_01650 [Candidatus Micrarchaeota archaeon]|nr:hypothetical protein [Candidatus Micrarchaeota archaeon]